MNKLVKKLDRIFSDYVRQRDADDRGIVRCATCGKFEHWKKMDCGHFMSRRFMSTRYDERNTGPQCQYCNRFSQGRQFEYGNYLDMKYGAGTSTEMLMKSKMACHRNRYDYEVLIKKFKIKLQNLKK